MLCGLFGQLGVRLMEARRIHSNNRLLQRQQSPGPRQMSSTSYDTSLSSQQERFAPANVITVVVPEHGRQSAWIDLLIIQGLLKLRFASIRLSIYQIGHKPPD